MALIDTNVILDVIIKRKALLISEFISPQIIETIHKDLISSSSVYEYLMIEGKSP